MSNSNLNIGIVGSGTSGLIAALLLKQAFSESSITVISSKKIGIVGVGEGSTEHWREFMTACDIPLEELLVRTHATHKYGIRFENWTRQTPDYFHSVSGDDTIYAFGLYPTYMGFIEREKLLTAQTSTAGLTENKIRRLNLHKNTNQFHFDTFKLNEYFELLCFERSIKLLDGDVASVLQNAETGNIESVNLENNDSISADFWIDASGFSRVLMTHMGNTDWESFSKYLLCDSAIAAPTESDPSNQIRPYTRALAMSSGWAWEIPTQERRGNGYVFSSQFMDEETAVEDLSKLTGYSLDKHRYFKFDPGYLKNPWVKNCCAVGLSSSFVEPLEATSIGSTIQQIRALIPHLASYAPSYMHSQTYYNKTMSSVMDNILTMIRLHYISDRRDTPFWQATSEMPINNTLQEMLDLWSERVPMRYDDFGSQYNLFSSGHFIHVAQGQNVLNIESTTRAIDRLNIRNAVKKDMYDKASSRNDHELVDHAESLRNLIRYD